MFYEYKRSVGTDYLQISRSASKNFTFPLHLHQSFELVYISKGTIRVQIADEEFSVSAGQAALIFPGQLHAYLGGTDIEKWTAIFSKDYLPELQPKHHPVFTLQPDLFDLLTEQRENPFAVRSLLYGVAAQYVQGALHTPKAMEQEHLICRIVQYLEAHYTEKITLQKMATDLGYHYRYLSGVVNRGFGVGFCKAVNQYRVDLACRLLKTEDLNVTEIAFRCGFDSLRNFNRCFKELTGKTPAEYKK